MTDEQWLKSFIKYAEDKISYDFTGGREQHARRLEEEVKKQPGRFVSLIHKMIADKRFMILILLKPYVLLENQTYQMKF